MGCGKQRIVEYVFVFALLVVLIFVLLLNFLPLKNERDHIRWHKEHADISVKEHNLSSVEKEVSSINEELNSSTDPEDSAE